MSPSCAVAPGLIGGVMTLDRSSPLMGDHPARRARLIRVSCMAYTKLHQSILRSTVWLEPNPTRIVWITMLALADKHGEVSGSVPGLANTARVTLDECKRAIATFMGPDPYSRTPDDEGRRIEPIDGGWQILNYEKYRLEASRDDQREKTAARTRRWREKRARQGVTQKPSQKGAGDAPVTHDRDIAEAEAEADSDHESVTTNITATTRAPAPKTNGRQRTPAMPEDWKPSPATQSKLRAALNWINPEIAGIRMVEFRAWAAELADPPTSQAQRDRIWLTFMLRTKREDFPELIRQGYNL